MVVLPSEKKINWQRPPWVLLGIVLLNVVIFFAYQSSDNEKYYEALSLYDEMRFIDTEAEDYLTYLQEKGFSKDEPLNYAEYVNLFEEDPKLLTNILLMDRGFYHWLADNRKNWAEADFKVWSGSRLAVEDQLTSISSYAFGLTPKELSITTLLSHQFMHGGFMHILGNMIFLVICGFAVEAALGSIRFLIFYLLCGIGGGLLFAGLELYSGSGSTPLVGASGSISGVMAMYLALFRLKKIEFFYWAFVFVGYFRAPALLILPFYIGKEVFSFLSETQSSVAYMAHTGGFVTGGILVALALALKSESIDHDYLEQDQNIDPYREKLDKVYRLIDDFQFGPAQKAVTALLSESGQRTELLLIQINLLKVDGGPAYQIAVNRLLNSSGYDTELVQAQLRIWQQLDDETKARLSAEQQIQLGLRLLETQTLTPVEAIIKPLLKQEQKEPMLAKLLTKLSNRYHQQDEIAKAKQYQQLAEQLSQGVS
ncbi:rhomboid family intramembrane serine protease [Endozoicomonas ascidiicola]|uniref:rhomboid family intramembrane serine protease n=1 Tax=Endozoicomonas ascidiicola TaxID=1698521 RepID=UPI000833F88B|nr:rhomboid family intramembrane serine protease [Endozoicomonas ascidiicola]